MNIRQVIALFSAAEEGLSVTEPQAVKIERIYQFLPPGKDALDLPCILHQYRPISETRGPNDMRMREYAVRIQILLHLLDADSDLWSEIAASFDDAIVSAMDQRVLLNEGSVFQRLYDFGGQEYQPSDMVWNGLHYIGTQYEYRVTVDDTVAFAP